MLNSPKESYFKFLKDCRFGDNSFLLTPNSDGSPYATCFWIFGIHLLKKTKILSEENYRLDDIIRNNLYNYRKKIKNDDIKKKPWRQLLTFSLSALHILGTLKRDPLEELIIEVLPEDILLELNKYGSLIGVPGSGNDAMFIAIFLIHSEKFLGLNNKHKIDQWVELHIKNQNKFGFWGEYNNISHSQFQNGYHQYEIFEYLNVHNPKLKKAADLVFRLMDSDGHFGPYPGGGSCYDYDAIFILTQLDNINQNVKKKIMNKTVKTILKEQNLDGGFCESCFMWPRNKHNFFKYVKHVLNTMPNYSLFYERLRLFLSLQQKKYHRISTHWTNYNRLWNESSLWDSWFRMLAIARIMQKFDKKKSNNWGFINYPGIGFNKVFNIKK